MRVCGRNVDPSGCTLSNFRLDILSAVRSRATSPSENPDCGVDRQGLVLGGRPVGEFVQEPAGQARRDLSQVLVLAPSQDPSHLVGVGRPGVGVGDPRREELVRREAGRLAGAHEDGREGPFEFVFRQGIGVFREAFQGVYRS